MYAGDVFWMRIRKGSCAAKPHMVQTIGRAARNVEGKAILYADRITESMQYAMDETKRRREKQIAFNEEHNITPTTVQKNVSKAFEHLYEDRKEGAAALGLSDDALSEFLHEPAKMRKHIDGLRKRMLQAAEDLEFEEAARLRDEIKTLEEKELGVL